MGSIGTPRVQKLLLGRQNELRIVSECVRTRNAPNEQHSALIHTTHLCLGAVARMRYIAQVSTEPYDISNDCGHALTERERGENCVSAVASFFH